MNAVQCRRLLLSCLCAAIVPAAAAQGLPNPEMRLLLLSNSTKAGDPYLDWPKAEIKAFLGDRPVTALLIPYAPVKISYDDLEAMVKPKFREIGHDIVGIHRFADPVKAVNEAQAIVVAGGNTFRLLHELRDKNLIEAVRRRVTGGMPYIGWSAGSNVAGPTIKTTNDMPIVDPKGFDAFALVPFQINPHYIAGKPAGFAGESRDDRIEEFVLMNPGVTVVGIPEQHLLRIERGAVRLVGPGKLRIFRKGDPLREVGSDEDLNFLLKR